MGSIGKGMGSVRKPMGSIRKTMGSVWKPMGSVRKPMESTMTANRHSIRNLNCSHFLSEMNKSDLFDKYLLTY